MARRVARPNGASPTSRRALYLRQVILLTLVWFGLNGKDFDSWIIGAPVVLAAALLGLAWPAGPTARPRLRGLAPFVACFLRDSARGGWDVARRVLHPRLRVEPGFLRFTISLPAGPARHLMVHVLTMLPGTVAVDLSGDQLLVHVIDVHAGSETSLRQLEKRVGRLFARAEESAG